MKEILKNLYIGNEVDYEQQVKGKEDWSVVQACKEPYHRQLLGYKGRGASKDHPEYLIAKRGNRLILNLVDADDPRYIPKIIIDRALEFIDNELEKNRRILVHCNKGKSRSPSIGLLYMAINGEISNKSFYKAEKDFKSIYLLYDPGLGIKKFLIDNWSEYC